MGKSKKKNNNSNDKSKSNNNKNNKNNNNKDKTCSKCQKKGHIASDCFSDVTCQKCHKKGHKTENCRTGQNSNQNNNQQNNNQQNNNQQNNKSTRPCSICQGRHLNKDCNAKSGIGPDGKPLKCKHCRGPHYNNQCWEKTDSNFPNSTGTSNQQKGQYKQHYNPNVSQPVSMSGLILRPCRYCMAEHLSDLCPHKEVLDAQHDFGEPNQPEYTWPGANLQDSPEQHWYHAAGRVQPAWGFVQNPPPSRKWQDDNPTRNHRHPDDLVPGHHRYVNGEYRSYGYGSEHLAFRERYPSRVNYDEERDVIMEDVENTGYDFTDEQKIDHLSQGIQDATLEALHARRRLSELRRGGILDGQYRPMFGY